MEGYFVPRVLLLRLPPVLYRIVEDKASIFSFHLWIRSLTCFGLVHKSSMPKDVDGILSHLKRCFTSWTFILPQSYEDWDLYTPGNLGTPLSRCCTSTPSGGGIFLLLIVLKSSSLSC